jgi:hypothetical protein
MLHRLLGCGFLAVMLGAAGCGGNVGSDDDGTGAVGGSSGSGSGTGGKSSTGGTGSGGKSSAGGTGAGGTSAGAGGASGSSGTGGFPATCGPGIQECCRGVCTIAIAKGCPQGPKTPEECECGFAGPTDACSAALARTYECLSAHSNEAALCDENGDTVLACGVCDAELAALGNACGGQLKCTFP